MKFISVCSGIEAASVAWNPLGWKAVAFSEIEQFPCAVLAHHYPDVPNYGDMTKFQEWPDHAIDLLCGGTPCQSFSVAGLRKGLDDPRGNLMLTFGAIAAKYRPRWLVWENVPGVLSSNGGRDFGAFLGLLGVLGYGFAYRVLDAQYFGVAQRRRRVFVVGCLGDWRAAAAVLFERHSMSGHPAPSREAGQTITPTIRAGAANGGAGHGARSGDSKDELITVHAPDIARCDATREGSSQDWETTTMVAHSLRGEGFDASEDGTGRGTPLVPHYVGGIDNENNGFHMDGVCGPLMKDSPTGGGRPLPAVAYTTKLHNTQSNQAGRFYENYTASLDANSPPPAIVFDTTQITSAANYSNPQPGDPCHPLAAGAHAPAIAQPYTLAIRGRGDGHNLEYRQDGTANALLTPNGGRGGIGVGAFATAMQVRRLTPVECERLQGFPDGYTAIPWRGKPSDQCPDGPRYKALGNSWAVPNVRWIGERIAAVDSLLQEKREAA